MEQQCRWHAKNLIEVATAHQRSLISAPKT